VEKYVKTLRAAAAAAGKHAEVRVNKAGCFSQCGHGPMIVVYPDDVWYAGVKESDLQEILDSPLVAEPLTRLMCAPTGDGASAALLVSAEKARQYTSKPVWVRGSALGSGKDMKPGMAGITARVARKAFEMAGMGPEDMNVMEVHDATAPAEIFIYEDLGLCPEGEGGRLIDEGVTELGGRVPVNTSGGLLSKGHPVGATGASMHALIYKQLIGEAIGIALGRGEHQRLIHADIGATGPWGR